MCIFAVEITITLKNYVKNEDKRIFSANERATRKKLANITYILFVMISDWIVRYFTHIFLIWVIATLFATAVGVTVYCAIVNKLNKKK